MINEFIQVASDRLNELTGINTVSCDSAFIIQIDGFDTAVVTFVDFKNIVVVCSTYNNFRINYSDITDIDEFVGFILCRMFYELL